MRMRSCLAAACAAFALSGAPAFAQDAPPAASADDPVELGDVIVNGTLETMTRRFVDIVSAPAVNRGLARWRRGVCVGVLNAREDIARPLVDHVSRMALEQGVTPGDPGCRPNVIIMFTDDPQGLTTTAVEEQRRKFRLGVGGLDRGTEALRQFQQSDAPVRWWHVSLPTNAQTGGPGIRLPGDEYAPTIASDGRVNRGRNVRDDMFGVYIVVDINGVVGIGLPQLADYIGLVTLAQVDPEGDTSQYATILNLFDDPDGTAGLTDWDRAYLRALYTGPNERVRSNEQTYQLLRNLRREREEPVAN